MQGTFRWKIEKNPKYEFSSIRAEFWFEPKKTSPPGATILFIQVVHERTIGGEAAFGATGTDAAKFIRDYAYKTSTNKKLGNFVDGFIPNNDNVYMLSSFDKDTKKWVDSRGKENSGHTGPMPVTVYSQDVASVAEKDIPAVGVTKELHLGKDKDIIFRVETVAICVETHEVLGAVRWGFKIGGVPGSPLEVLNGGPNDFSLTASDEFKKIIEKANTLKEVKFKINYPDTSKIKLGGSSALPPRYWW